MPLLALVLAIRDVLNEFIPFEDMGDSFVIDSVRDAIRGAFWGFGG